MSPKPSYFALLKRRLDSFSNDSSLCCYMQGSHTHTHTHKHTHTHTHTHLLRLKVTDVGATTTIVDPCVCVCVCVCMCVCLTRDVQRPSLQALPAQEVSVCVLSVVSCVCVHCVKCENSREKVSSAYANGPDWLVTKHKVCVCVCDCMWLCSANTKGDANSTSDKHRNSRKARQAVHNNAAHTQHHTTPRTHTHTHTHTHTQQSMGSGGNRTQRRGVCWCY